MGGKYRLGKRIDAGSSCEIYSGTNITTNEKVALKLESTKAEQQQLIYEARIMKSLEGEGTSYQQHRNS